MAEETAPVQNPHDFEIELERSRQSAARLRATLAQRLNSGADLAAVPAAAGPPRLQQVAGGIERLVRRSPVPAVIAAVFAGFLAGRAIRAFRQVKTVD